MEKLVSRMDEAEDRLPGLKDKVEGLDKVRKIIKFLTEERDTQEMWGTMKRNRPSSYRER